MPFFGTPDVEKLWLKGDTKGLLKALKHKRARIRQSAALALLEMGYARVVVEALESSTASELWTMRVYIMTLKEWDIIARRTAIERLVKMGTPTVGPLMNALGYEDARMRQSAAQALGQIGARLEEADLRTQIIESLIVALQDEEGDVRRAAARALGQISVQLRDPVLRVRVTKSLIAALKDNYENETVCQATAEALDELDWQPGRNQAGAIYWIAKGHPDRCVEIGQPAVQPLVAALKYMNGDVRRAAARSLKDLGWPPTRRESGTPRRITKGK